MKVKDTAEPYIVQKKVVLCRSGIQMYHRSEVEGVVDGHPHEEKEWYREYRPASVVVKAKSLCSSLPVTKEHPSEWVTPENFSALAGGTTDKEVEVVALDGESEGEIGLAADLTFYTRELFDYYGENKEVSLGYTCKKHFVDNPEEVGYDIVLDEITAVNHLAITKSGRGGSSVAIIDSLIGGMKPMRTGFIAFILGKRNKSKTFGQEVMDSLESYKGTSEQKAEIFKKVLDSCSHLKDGKGKSNLIDVIQDCFDSRDIALSEKDKVITAIDSLYASVERISIDSFKNMDSEEEKNSDEEKKQVLDEEEMKNSDEEEKDSESEEASEEEKSTDSESEEASEEEDSEDEETSEEKEKDSEEDKNLDSFKEELLGSLRGEIESVVKDILGVKDNKRACGITFDSALQKEFDYMSFVDI